MNNSAIDPRILSQCCQLTQPRCWRPEFHCKIGQALGGSIYIAASFPPEAKFSIRENVEKVADHSTCPCFGDSTRRRLLGKKRRTLRIDDYEPAASQPNSISTIVP